MPCPDTAPAHDLLASMLEPGTKQIACVGCPQSLTVRRGVGFPVCDDCEREWGPFPVDERTKIVSRKHSFPAIMAMRTATRAPDLGGRLHVPKRYADAQANDLVTAWAKSPAQVLVLTGATGTGKTWQGCGALRALLGSQGHAHMVNGAGLSRMNRVDFEWLSTCAALLIDDLGARLTPAALASAYELIEHRYSAMLPLIVTANLSLEGVFSVDERIGSRLASGRWIEMDGADRRLA